VKFPGTKEWRSTKDERADPVGSCAFASFGFKHSFVIRHSSVRWQLRFDDPSLGGVNPSLLAEIFACTGLFHPCRLMHSAKVFREAPLQLRSECRFPAAVCYAAELSQIPFRTAGRFTAALWESSVTRVGVSRRRELRRPIGVHRSRPYVSRARCKLDDIQTQDRAVVDLMAQLQRCPVSVQPHHIEGQPELFQGQRSAQRGRMIAA